MNKYCLSGILFLGVLGVLSGCKDESDIVFKNPEDRVIQNYLLQNGLTSVMQKTETGLYHRTLMAGNGLTPADSQYVQVEYTVRMLDGDGSEGDYYDATNLDLVEEHNLYPLFKFGGPALFRVGATSYDPGLSEGLKLMQEGDSMQFMMNTSLSSSTDSKPKEFFVKLVKVVQNIADVDANLVLASLDTITGGYSSVLVRDDAKSIRDYMYMSHLQQGTGAYPVANDYVDVKYTGRFLDGRVFDHSDSTRFTVVSTSSVLGFMEACGHLKVGGKATFVMPSILGFGEAGKREYANSLKLYQYIIAPFTPLVFDIEILGVAAAVTQ